jgi:NTE family protein
VDGGLVNPVPVDYLRLAGIEVCIAVNVVPRVDRKYIEKPTAIDVLLNAFDIMEHRIILSRNQPADIEIYPEVDQVSGIEFWRAKELIRLGEEAARERIDGILEAIGR